MLGPSSLATTVVLHACAVPAVHVLRAAEMGAIRRRPHTRKAMTIATQEGVTLCPLSRRLCWKQNSGSGQRTIKLRREVVPGRGKDTLQLTARAERQVAPAAAGDQTQRQQSQQQPADGAHLP